MKYIPKELKLGIKTESEHKGTIKWLKDYVKKENKFPPIKDIQRSIAKEHLREFLMSDEGFIPIGISIP